MTTHIPSSVFQAYDYLIIHEPDKREVPEGRLVQATDDPQEAILQAQELADRTLRTVHIYQHRRIIHPTR